MEFAGYKRFRKKFWKDGNEWCFECEWDRKGLDINDVIELARKCCSSDDIHVEAQPMDRQAESAGAVVKAESEEQLRCVCAYLLDHGWEPRF